MKKNTKETYFPALDGLRFVAFLFVFLIHFFSRNKVGEITNPAVDILFKTFKYNGWVGVDLFFVLSGFLITYLLLKEKNIYGSFSLKNFWIRRSLRIWPLYYLAVFAGFIIIPFLSSQLLGYDYSKPIFKEQILNLMPAYLLFLGNWSPIFQGYPEFLNVLHLWTISIEEQFYLIWPLILLTFKNFKRNLLICLGLILFSVVLRFIFALNNTPHPGIYMNTFLRMDTFVLGSLIAVIYLQKPKLLYSIRPFFKSIPLTLITLLFFYFIHDLDLLYSKSWFNLTFGYLAIGLWMVYFTIAALQENTFFNTFFSLKPLASLGKISYGLYIWHRVGTDIGVNSTKNFLPIPLQMLFSLIVIVIIGYASYHLFEIYFLKFKKKFTKVESKPI